MKTTMAALACAVLLGGSARAADTRGAMTASVASKSEGASAQGEAGDSTANPEIGLGLPISELDLSRIGAGNQRPGDPGLNVGARYLYQASRRWSLGAQISHANFGDRNFVVPGLAGTIGGSLLTVQGLARYWLLEPAAINPYVIGGLGLNRFAAHVRETFEPSAVLLDADSVGLAVSAGGGLEGRFGEARNLIAGTELRWLLSTIDAGKFGSSTLNGVGVTGWVGYKF